jgi:hypothetical protein
MLSVALARVGVATNDVVTSDAIARRRIVRGARLLTRTPRGRRIAVVTILWLRGPRP